MIIDPGGLLNPTYIALSQSKYKFQVFEINPETEREYRRSIFIACADDNYERIAIGKELEAAGYECFNISVDDLSYDRSPKNSYCYRAAIDNENITVYILTDYKEFMQLHSIWQKAVTEKVCSDLSFSDFAKSARCLALSGNLHFNQAKKAK